MTSLTGDTAKMRRRLFGVLTATAMGGATAAVLLSAPSAVGASDPCAASEMARTIGNVARSAARRPVDAVQVADQPSSGTRLHAGRAGRPARRAAECCGAGHLRGPGRRVSRRGSGCGAGRTWPRSDAGAQRYQVVARLVLGSPPAPACG